LIKNSQIKDWIKVKSKKKFKEAPSEIRIDMKGNVYIDGEIYDGENSKYKCLSIDIENHNRLNLGEETRKIIDISKEAKKGDTITIKDVKGPDRTESTTVKF
jgi:hypothetical protein